MMPAYNFSGTLFPGTESNSVCAMHSLAERGNFCDLGTKIALEIANLSVQLN